MAKFSFARRHRLPESGAAAAAPAPPVGAADAAAAPPIPFSAPPRPSPPTTTSSKAHRILGELQDLPAQWGDASPGPSSMPVTGAAGSDHASRQQQQQYHHQASVSAMPRGLPSKASALLDIGHMNFDPPASPASPASTSFSLMAYSSAPSANPSSTLPTPMPLPPLEPLQSLQSLPPTADPATSWGNKLLRRRPNGLDLSALLRRSKTPKPEALLSPPIPANSPGPTPPPVGFGFTRDRKRKEVDTMRRPHTSGSSRRVGGGGAAGFDPDIPVPDIPVSAIGAHYSIGASSSSSKLDRMYKHYEDTSDYKNQAEDEKLSHQVEPDPEPEPGRRQEGAGYGDDGHEEDEDDAKRDEAGSEYGLAALSHPVRRLHHRGDHPNGRHSNDHHSSGNHDGRHDVYKHSHHAEGQSSAPAAAALVPPLAPPPLSADTASVSSSRRTAGSRRAMASNLQLRSVLSLSSGSEDDDDSDHGQMADGVGAFLLEPSRVTTPVSFAPDLSSSPQPTPPSQGYPHRQPAVSRKSSRSRKKRESIASADTHLSVPSHRGRSASPSPSSPATSGKRRQHHHQQQHPQQLALGAAINTAGASPVKSSPSSSSSARHSNTSTNSTAASSASRSSSLAQHLGGGGGLMNPPPPPAGGPPTGALPMIPPIAAAMGRKEGGGSSTPSSIRSSGSTPTARSHRRQPSGAPSAASSHRQQQHSLAQDTPPLTPSSGAGTAMDTDAGADTVADSEFASTDGGSNRDSFQNPRLMAVTRQEELLLAALRRRRAMMRENLLAEFQEESVDQRQQQSSPAPPATAEKSQRIRIETANQPLAGHASVSRAGSGQDGGTTSQAARGPKTRASLPTLSERQPSGLHAVPRHSPSRDALGVPSTTAGRVAAHRGSSAQPRSNNNPSSAGPGFTTTGTVPSPHRSLTTATVSRTMSLASQSSRGSAQSETVLLFLDHESADGRSLLSLSQHHPQQQQRQRHPSKPNKSRKPSPPPPDSPDEESEPSPDLCEFMEFVEPVVQSSRHSNGEDHGGGGGLAETEDLMDEDLKEEVGDAFLFPVPGGRASIGVGVGGIAGSGGAGVGKARLVPTRPARPRHRPADLDGNRRGGGAHSPQIGRHDTISGLTIPEEEVAAGAAEAEADRSSTPIRPDSPPITPAEPPALGSGTRGRAVRLSAVGGRGMMEAGWWGHDG